MALSNEFPGKPIPFPRGVAGMSPHLLYQSGAENLLEPKRAPADFLASIRPELENIQHRLTGTEVQPDALDGSPPPLPSTVLASDNVAARVALDGSIILMEDATPDAVQMETGIVFPAPEKLHGIRQFLRRANRARGHRPTHVPEYAVLPGDRKNKKIAVGGGRVLAIKKPDGRWSRNSHENREVFTNQIHAQDIADGLTMYPGTQTVPKSENIFDLQELTTATELYKQFVTEVEASMEARSDDDVIEELQPEGSQTYEDPVSLDDGDDFQNWHEPQAPGDSE